MDVPEIDVDDLAQRQEAGQVILDVRSPEEYDEAHVPGVVLIPLGELVDRLDEVPRGEGELPVICGSGPRSYRAAEFLREQGIEAVNVMGGTRAWMDAGFPVETGGAPA